MPESMFKKPGGMLLHQMENKKLSLCQNRDLFMSERIAHQTEKSEWMIAQPNTDQPSQTGAFIHASYSASIGRSCCSLQAIESVLNQTYSHFELLVVNDCSTDRTVDLVKEIATQDKRVRLISNQKNSGVSYTRKHGLDEARGLWIAILDSDDAWAPEKLEKQIALAILFFDKYYDITEHMNGRYYESK